MIDLFKRLQKLFWKKVEANDKDNRSFWAKGKKVSQSKGAYFSKRILQAPQSSFRFSRVWSRRISAFWRPFYFDLKPFTSFPRQDSGPTKLGSRLRKFKSNSLNQLHNAKPWNYEGESISPRPYWLGLGCFEIDKQYWMQWWSWFIFYMDEDFPG